VATRDVRGESRRDDARIDRSGRAWLEAAMAGEIPGPPALTALGMRLIEVGDGRAAFEIDPEHRHDNLMGMMHGGVVCTLIDAAAGCAVLAALPPGKVAPSQDIRVTFVRPATTGGGTLRAEGAVLNLGRRTALAEARLVDTDGRLIAHGTLTCAIVDPDRVPNGRGPA
jgi:uncharacterized protein (TIGR00369 family)